MPIVLVPLEPVDARLHKHLRLPGLVKPVRPGCHLVTVGHRRPVKVHTAFDQTRQVVFRARFEKNLPRKQLVHVGGEGILAQNRTERVVVGRFKGLEMTLPEGT